MLKKTMLVSLLLGFCIPVLADSSPLDEYIAGFSYEARKEMKIDSKELVALLKQGKAQLIDIRFAEEYSTWKVGPSRNIPLNELPSRLDEIDSGKVVVMACPHKDRATVAMVYLRSKGIQAKYLTDGLIGLAENLRGDDAKELSNALDKLSGKTDSENH